MNSRQKVANRILKLCDERRLALNALANRSAVPPSTLKSIINGDSKNPGIVTIKLLCDGLGISLYEFFDDEVFSVFGAGRFPITQKQYHEPERQIIMESNGKVRPLYLFKLLYELTDEDHPLTTNELIQLLDDRFSIKTQRTRIAQDIEALEAFGFEIGRVRGQSNNYYFDKRAFEPAELKLLIDAVQSSLFITERKSRELTEKIAKLAPEYIGHNLLRLSGNYTRLKQRNEQIYYIVDTINRAILQKQKISFGYFEYDIYKRRKLRHNGVPYVLSPYALVWDNDLYYVVGYYEKYGIVSNFRVDRIAHVPEILDQSIIPEPDSFDLDEYRSSMMRMYNSERKTVEMACDFSVMDAIVDKFGEAVDTGLIDEKTFSVTVETAVNHIFYSWVFGFGGKVRILEPRDVVEGYADMVLHAANTLVSEM